MLQALRNTRMLATYSNIDERVKPLGYALKYFAKVLDISTYFHPCSCHNARNNSLDIGQFLCILLERPTINAPYYVQM